MTEAVSDAQDTQIDFVDFHFEMPGKLIITGAIYAYSCHKRC